MIGYNSYTSEAFCRHLRYLPDIPAIASSDASALKVAEIKEVQGLINRGWFKMVDRPANFTPLPTTKVFKYKYFQDNNVTVRQCRLCVMGDRQREGVTIFNTRPTLLCEFS
jgi:hypothetical protein